jgi:hypothetical protein
MAKATAEQGPIFVNLKLSEEEAAFLHALVGRVCGPVGAPQSVYDALDEIKDAYPSLEDKCHAAKRRLTIKDNPSFN